MFGVVVELALPRACASLAQTSPCGNRCRRRCSHVIPFSAMACPPHPGAVRAPGIGTMGLLTLGPQTGPAECPAILFGRSDQILPGRLQRRLDHGPGGLRHAGGQGGRGINVTVVVSGGRFRLTPRARVTLDPPADRVAHSDRGLRGSASTMPVALDTQARFSVTSRMPIETARDQRTGVLRNRKRLAT